MFAGKFRQSVDTSMAPVGRWLVRIGFSADVLTGSGLVFACATAWAIAVGYHWLAIILLTLTGAHDLLDGAVAKASQRASQRVMALLQLARCDAAWSSVLNSSIGRRAVWSVRPKNWNVSANS